MGSGKVFGAVLLAFALGAGGASAQLVKTKTPAGIAHPFDLNNPQDMALLLNFADDLYYGDFGPVDAGRAFGYYTLAAEAGSASAMNRLGLMYDNGDWLERDLTQAFTWFLRAAEAGHPDAMGNVGSMYEFGDGVATDLTAALSWYRRGANAGDDYSMVSLGYMFLSGKGVTENAAIAADWFQRATDAGSAEGAWMLALRYIYGDGVAEDTARAARLAYQALTQGHAKARDELLGLEEADTPHDFRTALQRLLADNGFYAGKIDGSFGPQSQAAVTAAFGTAWN